MVSKLAVRIALAVILVPIALIAVLLVCMAKADAAEVTHHHTGMPLMKGVKTPTDLAALVDSSLKVDKTGKQVLDPKRCKMTGSCATAEDYFLGINAAHRNAHLGDITDLSRYLRSLVKKPAPAGEWHMSRLLVKGDSHRYDATGWHRAFFKGEAAWYDINTGEPILAEECNNVVGERYVPLVAKLMTQGVCATVHYTVAPGDEVRFAVLARKRLQASACWQLCDGDVCSAPPAPCDECDWTNPEEVIPDGFEPLHTGRYVAEASKQTLRYPIEVEANYIALCLTREGPGQSDSWIIQPAAWQGRAVHVVSVPYGGQEWPTWDAE
ncbi:MAG: hypothetical protein ACHQU0_01340 [Candidatus Paceibacteria bacterium]